ncbi:MAG: Do family serine endopeptidase [Lacunisphaera sp.]|nr:Do family serine endopeptidase [Lacunisphaera sp.]
MHTKSVVRFLALVTSILGLALGLLAVDKAAVKPALPVRKPVLKIDGSPIGDSKVVVTSYADALENIRPAVVSVYSSKVVRQQVPDFLRQYGLRGGEQKQRGLGSGVIISTDGFIITNNHVVEEADELKVLLNDEREFTAKVIGTDPKTDVAVIKIEAEYLPAAILSDSAKLRVGDVVFAIGNPLGVGQTVTMGIVSATGRRVGILDEVAGYEDFIQTDAAINQGNSGGALIDARGRLVGINSAIISTSSGNIGIGFSIPINLASSIMNSLIETGTVSRGYLGVSTDTLAPDLAESLGVKPDTKGVIITDLNPADGPAAKAGLKREDIITAINDKTVASRDDLRLYIAQTAPGTKITVKYIREGKPQTVDVALGKLPDNYDATGELLPGITVTLLTGELRKDLRIADRVDGIVIADISPQSRYREVFPLGAVIQEINSTPVTDLLTARGALIEGRNRALIYHRGSNRYVLFVVR